MLYTANVHLESLHCLDHQMHEIWILDALAARQLHHPALAPTVAISSGIIFLFSPSISSFYHKVFLSLLDLDSRLISSTILPVIARIYETFGETCSESQATLHDQS